MLVSKEFYVDEYDLENMSCFTVSRHPAPMRDRTLKITISYEIDREVTIKESDVDRLFSNNTRFTYKDIEIMKRLFFGGGENDV